MKKKQQAGFTLIELVVVIVILGILAAAAVPKFSTITGQAETAVAEGILGAVLSASVIQFGVNQGSASSLATIKSEVDASEGFTLTGPCTGTNDSVTVTVTSTGASAIGIIPDGLCNG
jgi:prepilin-type N-terminal cleavage/methylation domain-containing protein